MNCSTCEKWSLMGDPFKITRVEEAGDWKYSTRASLVMLRKIGCVKVEDGLGVALSARGMTKDSNCI